MNRDPSDAAAAYDYDERTPRFGPGPTVRAKIQFGA